MLTEARPQAVFGCAVSLSKVAQRWAQDLQHVTFASARNPEAALPMGADGGPSRPYGARTNEAVVVGDLLTQHAPEIASGEIEIVAITRRPGELSKVAVRRRLRLQPRAPRPVPLVLGSVGERIRVIKRELPAQEHIDIVQWHPEPLRYIAAALGLSYVPSAVLYPIRHRADILLGEIDYPGRAWPARAQHVAHLGVDLLAGPGQADCSVSHLARARSSPG